MGEGEGEGGAGGGGHVSFGDVFLCLFWLWLRKSLFSSTFLTSRNPAVPLARTVCVLSHPAAILRLEKAHMRMCRGWRRLRRGPLGPVCFVAVLPSGPPSLPPSLPAPLPPRQIKSLVVLGNARSAEAGWSGTKGP